jgi:hypothetical protein
MQEVVKAITNQQTTVTIGDQDMTLMEAAQHLAKEALETMEGERLQKALMVSAAVADYASIDR